MVHACFGAWDFSHPGGEIEEKNVLDTSEYIRMHKTSAMAVGRCSGATGCVGRDVLR